MKRGPSDHELWFDGPLFFEVALFLLQEVDGFKREKNQTEITAAPSGL